MKQMLKSWWRGDAETGGTSIRNDLRSGQAGWQIRLGLSVAAAALIAASVMFVIGIVALLDVRVDDDFVLLGLTIGGAGWCGVLVKLWSGYARWRRTLTTIFSVLVIWLITVPLCVLIDMVLRQGEFLIVSILLFAIALSSLIVATAAYRGLGGKPLHEKQMVRVHCPTCGYSMVGLETCVCPECGEHFTIDELIGAQDYAALRRSATAEDGAKKEQGDVEPNATADRENTLRLRPGSSTES